MKIWIVIIISVTGKMINIFMLAENVLIFLCEKMISEKFANRKRQKYTNEYNENELSQRRNFVILKNKTKIEKIFFFDIYLQKPDAWQYI